MDLALKETRADQKTLQEQLRLAEGRARDLESRVDNGTRGASETEILRRRLTEQLDDEKERHKKDVAERDVMIDQTRKKYQGELALLSEELQSQRDTISRLRDESRKTRAELDQLHLQYDDEVYSSGAWKKEKERLESKISDLTSAYESATGVQSEQQSQIVNLLSQVRELRGVLDEAEADRTALQKARRNLESRLNDIAQGSSQSDKLSSDRVLQALHLEKQDLRSSLDAQRDRVTLATERLKKAEAHAIDCQSQLNKVRHENAELDRRNANLEKQVKELKLRVVDQETRAYATSPKSSPHVKRLEVRVEELTNKLNQELKEKAESDRAFRDAGTSARNTQFQLSESERARARLEADVKDYEMKLEKLRSSSDELQSSESELQVAKRQAELDASEQRQKVLALEREVERLRFRLERPLLERSSPSSSPRK
ncbi:uncharacterized protein EI90DRAFT_1618233 [Cantharellus anzutake]|uniref:uncharacterized protein n=2 Tax=Cantharellus anzutake TaxID=1750568 RepID=UPI001907539D|nr:uncharacterized protein EI90DRAFT_1618233 [Cantharellus anzutake]KAF8328237.1 hypothetical protein EI90DRAFT_1618233 [Cantharellus anzutake]